MKALLVKNGPIEASNLEELAVTSGERQSVLKDILGLKRRAINTIRHLGLLRAPSTRLKRGILKEIKDV